MRRFLLLTGLALLAVAPARADEPRDLDAALKVQAGKILDYARKHNAKNITVLKFLVRTGDGPFDSNAGPLNNGLADRLSVALVLALPNDDIGVIRNAEEVLAKSNANHLDKDGRAACFDAKGFLLAWGDPEIMVNPDLFITGTATLSKDLKKTTLRFQAFGNDCKLDESLDEVTVPTSARTLIDAGRSYLITPKSNPDMFKGARGRPKEDLDNVAADASQKFNADLNNNPSGERELPVRVTIYYGDEPVQPDKNGNIREPKDNEKTVRFKIENLSDDVHGVVLKVNGENSIFREKFDDKDCTKWLLAPRGKQIGNMRDTVVVSGYQVDDQERKDFNIQSTEVSKANEVRYGPLVGTFQVTVFRAKGDKPDPEPAPPPVVKVKEEQQSIAAISRGVLKIGKIQPGNLEALQAELRRREGERSTATARGLIGPAADSKASPVEKIAFVPDPPIPVMSYRIRYYQAGNGK